MKHTTNAAPVAPASRAMTVMEATYLFHRLVKMQPRQRIAAVNHLCTLVDIADGYPRLAELCVAAASDIDISPAAKVGSKAFFKALKAGSLRTPEQMKNFRALLDECRRVTLYAGLSPSIVDDFLDDTEAPARFLQYGDDLYSATYYKELRA